MLMRRVAEINAIAKLQAMSQTKEFTQAAAQAASAPLQVAQDLVTNPVSTISSVPKGIWGFLNQAGEAVKEVAEGRQNTTEEGNAVENMTGFSKTKRKPSIGCWARCADRRHANEFISSTLHVTQSTATLLGLGDRRFAGPTVPVPFSMLRWWETWRQVQP